MPDIKLGSGADFLNLRVQGRTKPDARDYWDGNWLHCTAEASAGTFRGTIDWQLRNEDLIRFMRALESLDERAGAALLDTGDGWIDVRITRTEEGQVEARCQLADIPVGGSSMEFRLLLDQTALERLIDQVREVVEQFPLIAGEGA